MRFGGNTHQRFVALLLAGALVAVAGCGGSDEDDAADVASAAEEALTSTEPSSCVDLQTAAYRQQIQLSEGEFAITTCQQELEFSASDSAKASNVEVDGDTATADVALTGGPFDGQVVSYELAKEDGQWKLDRLVGFAKFDHAAFGQSLDRLLEQGKRVNPANAACINQQLKNLSESELEALYTSGDLKQYLQLYAPCAKVGQ